MILSVLAGIAPVFLMIAAGYAAARTGYIPADAIRLQGVFVLRVALPALVLDALTAQPLSDTVTWGYLLGYGGGSLAAFGIGYLTARRIAGRDAAASAVSALGVSMSNSGFMGYPIAQMVIGAPAAAIVAQNLIIENMILIPLVVIISEAAAGASGSTGKAVRDILRGQVRNPLLIAMAIGVAISGGGVSLPQPVAQPIAWMAAVAGPIALFVVGGTLARISLRGAAGPVAGLTAGKLLLHPLAVLCGLALMPDLDATMLIGGVIFAAMPMASMFPLIGARYGMSRLSAAALLAATLVSALTITLLIVAMAWAGVVRFVALS